MLALMVSQAQLGTCLITIFMGRVMFMEEHSVRAVLKQFFKPAAILLVLAADL